MCKDQTKVKFGNPKAMASAKALSTFEFYQTISIVSCKLIKSTEGWGLWRQKYCRLVAYSGISFLGVYGCMASRIKNDCLSWFLLCRHFMDHRDVCDSFVACKSVKIFQKQGECWSSFKKNLTLFIQEDTKERKQDLRAMYIFSICPWFVLSVIFATNIFILADYWIPQE